MGACCGYIMCIILPPSGPSSNIMWLVCGPVSRQRNPHFLALYLDAATYDGSILYTPWTNTKSNNLLNSSDLLQAAFSCVLASLSSIYHQLEGCIPQCKHIQLGTVRKVPLK